MQGARNGAGAKDGIVDDSFTEMAAKDKVSSDFLTTKPADVGGKEVERWKKRMATEGK